MSTIKVDNLQTTGGAGLYPARAWVNFNGTGTVAIRADGNVSSITDNGNGDYTVNFTTSLVSSNYSFDCNCSQYSANANLTLFAAIYGSSAGGAAAKTSSSIRFGTRNNLTNSQGYDMAEINAVAI